MLELGCGRGDLLAGAAAVGWKVHGVEMTATFVDPACPAEIEIGRLESAALLGRTYDFVLLAAILEHVYDPMSCLRQVYGALKPGGVLFIDVPNECSLWTKFANAYQRLRGRRWAVNLSPTFAPFHVVGFCPRSLSAALKTVGLEVLKLQTHRWGNDLPEPATAVGHLESAAAEATLSLGAWLGMGAGMSAWARKPANVRSDA
jgi:SAM-dependent methyltransferase